MSNVRGGGEGEVNSEEGRTSDPTRQSEPEPVSAAFVTVKDGTDVGFSIPSEQIKLFDEASNQANERQSPSSAVEEMKSLWRDGLITRNSTQGRVLMRVSPTFCRRALAFAPPSALRPAHQTPLYRNFRRPPNTSSIREYSASLVRCPGCLSLRESVSKGHLTCLQKLVEKSPPAGGESFLHVIVALNSLLPLNQALTLPGVNVDIENHAGMTPLHMAILKGSHPLLTPISN